MKTVSLKATGGVVQLLLPPEAAGLAMQPAEARSMAFMLWGRAREADLQRRDSDPAESGPFVVLSQRSAGAPWGRSPIIPSRWKAELCRDRLLGSGDVVAARVVPLVELVDCDGR